MTSCFALFSKSSGISGRGAAGRISLLILAIVAMAGPLTRADGAQPMGAAALLELFDNRLQEESEGEDVTRVEADLAGLRAARQPNLRLRQSIRWNYSGRPDLGLGFSLAVPLLDPEHLAREAQVEQRLLLARFNDQSQRQRRRIDFRRKLRLIAHLQEVEEVLAHHQRTLLERRPGLLELQRERSGVIDQEELAFLEIAQALASSERERQLLLEWVARQVGLTGEELAAAQIGRLPPAPAEELEHEACLGHNDQLQRAELVQRETLLAAQAEAAVAHTQVTLDLAGDLGYEGSASGIAPDSAWRADLRLSLRFGLPNVAGLAPGLSLRASPADVSQEVTVQWPPPAAARPDLLSGSERAYRQARDEARLEAMRAFGNWRDSADRAELRGLSVVRAEQALSAGGRTAVPALEQAVAQAKLALLNAELERDLAALELDMLCGPLAHARTSATSRFRPSIRSTIAASSA